MRKTIVVLATMSALCACMVWASEVDDAKAAALKGDAAAQCQMGLFYMNGLGVDRDEDKAVEWLKAGGCIPNEPRLKSELTVTEYKFTSAGKIILQPKEEIKELTGHSPDGADSAVLTFAVQIHKATTGRRRVLMANTEYSF